MRRRDFLSLASAASAVLAFPGLALAQQAAKVPHIAYLSTAQLQELLDAFRQGLADYGRTEGKDIAVEFFTAPTNAQLPAQAAQAVASRPDVILAFGATAAQVAKGATNTIPIVFANASNPLGAGLVSNLAHPGGNVTGTSFFEPDLAGKQIAIVRDIMPTMKRIVILYDPAFPASKDIVLQAAASAKELGIDAVTISIDEGQDFARQLEQVAAAGADAVYVPPGNYWGNVADVLLDFQTRSRLPIVNSNIIAGKDPPFAGIVSYGPSTTATLRRAASFIDAILKGARPGDLPVEAPTVFDFAVNAGAAQAIGISIPPSILAQATQVIQ